MSTDPNIKIKGIRRIIKSTYKNGNVKVQINGTYQTPLIGGGKTKRST